MIGGTVFRAGRAVLAGLGNLYDAVIPPRVMESSAARAVADRPAEVSAVPPVPSAGHPVNEDDDAIKDVAALTDSELLDTAAFVIAGWKAALRGPAGMIFEPDALDAFVHELRDRAAQFAAIDADAAKPFLTPADLGAALRPVGGTVRLPVEFDTPTGVAALLRHHGLDVRFDDPQRDRTERYTT